MRVVPVAAVLLVAAVSAPARAADPLLARAEESYQRGQFAKARDAILSLLDYRALHGGDVSEARAYLAASYLALKDRVSARNQLVLLAREAPDYRLDPVTFVPELLTLAEEARAIVELEAPAKPNAQRGDAERRAEGPAVDRRTAQTDGGQRVVAGEVAQTDGPSSSPAQVTKAAEPRKEAPLRPSLRLTPAVGVVLDAAGRSVGPSASAWIGYGEVEFGPRLVIGALVGIGGELAYVPWPGRVTPRFAARVSGFPGASAFGGGPAMGLRVPIAGGLSATGEVGAEFFHAPDGFRNFALTLGVGLGFDVVGGGVGA